MRAFRFAWLIVLALFVLPGTGFGPRSVAAADVFTFREAYEDTFSFDACGFLIEGTVSGRYHEVVWADPGAGTDVLGNLVINAIDHHDTGGGTYTNPANGKSLEFSYSDHFKEELISYNGPVPVTLPDGSTGVAASYTLSWSERGVPIKIKLPRGGVVSIDAGLITDWVVDVIFYYFDIDGDGAPEWLGEVISGNEPAVHGPHPLFGTDRFCEIMNQYLA
jgi:hypothetical protein